ncbi:MAG: hypothetical protein KatS3mg108_3361 [Isosphaeraceae bacterium]|nr:MAG: hypothetical protein KatS3mg108_3361 [Isosphaeraceae bacterium]
MVRSPLEAQVRAALARAVAGAEGLLGEADLVELVEVDPQGVALVRLRGPCASCPSTLQPLILMLDQAVRAEVPEIRLVELVP